MFHGLRGGSWQLGTQPASDKERQQRQALPSPPARPHPPAMRHRRQPQGRVHFRRLVAVFNARLLAADRYRLRCPTPLAEDAAPQRLQPSLTVSGPQALLRGQPSSQG